ncbi:MAG: outer membrane protein OmpA-like peptidoglycan-associated protein [Alphaproteobacteria bacterium]|jgi:outer membrane protein OmpA-like peptidoglycan-associated protein
MKKSIVSISLAVALMGGCASKPTISENEVFTQYPSVLEASKLIEEANGDNLMFFSPEQMKETTRVYEAALNDAKAGKANAKTLAQEAVARAKAARVQADSAKYTFEEVLLAREKALNVNARSVVVDEFAEAEKEFAKAIALLEVGQEERAKRDIDALKNQYLAIELNALKTNMLNVAQQAVAKAIKDDLDDVAPRTVAQAKDELELAVDTLEANRIDTVKANIHSNRAIWLIKQAEGIADIDAYFNNADFDNEQEILWYQDQLSDVVSPVNKDVQFNTTNKRVVAKLRQQLAALVNENTRLLANLDASKMQIKTITSESQSKQNKLERDNAQAIMQAKLQRDKELAEKAANDQRFAVVQSMFAEEEATVYRQRDNVLIRAHGFSFKSGGSQIESSNFVMLNKISDAIKRFPDANVVISGHTDSTGSPEINQSLSQARAEVVANFITQVSEIDTDKVTFLGHGEDKPVATNDTVDGRAQNRRVEILIVNK